MDILYTGIGRSVSFPSKKERSVKEKFCKADMNDPRKSDNNIVPEKPANNGSNFSAEQVEGRALTKGNIMTTAAVRTQRRGAAVDWFSRCMRISTFASPRFQRYYPR